MKKRALAFILTVIMAVGLSVPAFAVDGVTFDDVYWSDWFADDVRYVYAGNLMQAEPLLDQKWWGLNPYGHFYPQDKAWRAVVVTALYRLDGSPECDGQISFSDVYETSFFRKEIVWAATNGIVNGYDDGRFGGGDFITREQLATVLYRFARYKGMDVTKQTDLAEFVDQGNISSYAREAMSWANATGLINGTSDTTLDPQGYTTRAQLAAIVHRFGQNLMGIYYDASNAYYYAYQLANYPTDNTIPSGQYSEEEFLSLEIFEEVKDYAISLGYDRVGKNTSRGFAEFQVFGAKSSRISWIYFQVELNSYWGYGVDTKDGHNIDGGHAYSISDIKNVLLRYADY